MSGEDNSQSTSQVATPAEIPGPVDPGVIALLATVLDQMEGRIVDRVIEKLTPTSTASTGKESRWPAELVGVPAGHAELIIRVSAGHAELSIVIGVISRSC